MSEDLLRFTLQLYSRCVLVQDTDEYTSGTGTFLVCTWGTCILYLPVWRVTPKLLVD